MRASVAVDAEEKPTAELHRFSCSSARCVWVYQRVGLQMRILFSIFFFFFGLVNAHVFVRPLHRSSTLFK